MTDLPEKSGRTRLQQLCRGNEPIPAMLVEELLVSDDLLDQSAAYECITERWHRISPEPEDWFVGPRLVGYLFRCITEPRQSATTDSHVHSNYEAAHHLLGILLRRFHVDDDIVLAIAAGVESAFLNGDEKVRDCLEMGFLEHALERPELRPLFAHWARRSETRESHERALQWGRAHQRQSG